jgi:putative transposase
MPGPLRVLISGASYHVIARGNGGRMVFVDDRDRHDFLRRLRRIAADRDWLCSAYCLMGTHLHLVVSTPKADLPHGMRDLLGTYARAFNWRYGSPGHLFRDRHLAVVIEDDGQMAATVAYVLRNPVRAGLIADAARWPWSNCAYLIGEQPLSGAVPFTSLNALTHFGATTHEARDELRRHLERAQRRDEIYPRPGQPEKPLEFSPSLGRRDTTDAVVAALDAGYTQSDIARLLGVSQAAVSRRLSRQRAA